MDENLELEQEIDEAFADIEETDEKTDLEEETVEEVETEESEADSDEELEYDEDGNVIVAEDNETVTEDNNEEEPKSEPVVEEKKDVTEYDNLKKRHDDRESLIKDVLKIVGIDEADVDQGLAKLAAETEGVTVEEFLKKRAETIKTEEAQKYYNQMLLDRSS